MTRREARLALVITLHALCLPPSVVQSPQRGHRCRLDARQAPLRRRLDAGETLTPKACRDRVRGRQGRAPTSPGRPAQTPARRQRRAGVHVATGQPAARPAPNVLQSKTLAGSAATCRSAAPPIAVVDLALARTTLHHPRGENDAGQPVDPESPSSATPGVTRSGIAGRASRASPLPLARRGSRQGGCEEPWLRRMPHAAQLQEAAWPPAAAAPPGPRHAAVRSGASAALELGHLVSGAGNR